MSTALVSAFYDVDDVLYQVNIKKLYIFAETWHLHAEKGKGFATCWTSNLLQPYWKLRHHMQSFLDIQCIVFNVYVCCHFFQNRINSTMTRSTVMNMESPRKIAGMTSSLIQHHHHQQIPQHHHHQQIPQQSHQQQIAQPNHHQFRSRTGSISSTSSMQSDNSGYSFNSSSMSMGKPQLHVVNDLFSRGLDALFPGGLSQAAGPLCQRASRHRQHQRQGHVHFQ